MSLTLSVRMPSGTVPAPFRLMEQLREPWPNYQHSPKLKVMHLLKTNVSVKCPQLEEYGDKQWQLDTAYCFYLSEVSTRGLEVCYRDGIFSLRILVLSCMEEWELAFQILERVSNGKNLLIESDSDPAQFRLNDIREVFDEELITSIISVQIGNVFNAAKLYKETYQFSGPINSFSVGPWVVSKICKSVNENEMDHQRSEIMDIFFGMMRLVNYVGSSSRFHGHVAPRYFRLLAGGQPLVAELYPCQSYLVGKVDLLLFSDWDGAVFPLSADSMRVEMESFFRLPDELVWLDEHMFAFGPVSHCRFKEFSKRLSSHRKLLNRRSKDSRVVSHLSDPLPLIVFSL